MEGGAAMAADLRQETAALVQQVCGVLADVGTTLDHGNHVLDVLQPQRSTAVKVNVPRRHNNAHLRRKSKSRFISCF